jgi:hypothetical protein
VLGVALLVYGGISELKFGPSRDRYFVAYGTTIAVVAFFGVFGATRKIQSQFCLVIVSILKLKLILFIYEKMCSL